MNHLLRHRFDMPTEGLGRLIRINVVFEGLQRCQPQRPQGVQRNVCFSPNPKAMRPGVHMPEIASQAPTTIFESENRPSHKLQAPHRSHVASNPELFRGSARILQPRSVSLRDLLSTSGGQGFSWSLRFLRLYPMNVWTAMRCSSQWVLKGQRLMAAADVMSA